MQVGPTTRRLPWSRALCWWRPSELAHPWPFVPDGGAEAARGYCKHPLGCEGIDGVRVGEMVVPAEELGEAVREVRVRSKRGVESSDPLFAAPIDPQQLGPQTPAQPCPPGGVQRGDRGEAEGPGQRPGSGCLTRRQDRACGGLE